jgi:2-amino-4-hydroxy-6-hydroxymethyldihydropteridine diphosphokinase
LGNKERNLNNAVKALNLQIGKVQKQSSLHSSKPWGFDSENDFLNVVVLIDTSLSPFDVLEKALEIERKMGRKVKTTKGYTDRLIDIDILLYDNLIIDQPALKIPHPLMGIRDFVLIPMAEIAPDLVHPVLGKKIIELLNG